MIILIVLTGLLAKFEAQRVYGDDKVKPAWHIFGNDKTSNSGTFFSDLRYLALQSQTDGCAHI